MTILLLLLLATPIRYERVVTPGGSGPNRLDVDVTLLGGAHADLRDVRFVDAQNREVGYLLVPPATKEREWISGRLLPVASTKTTSGFEVDLGRATNVDRLRLGGIDAPFLKHVTLEGSGDRARWTLLADATVFDLPDQQLHIEEIAFDAGDYRYLRVTWDDRTSARVSGTIRASARRHELGDAPESLWAYAQFAKRPSEPAKSRYRIELPGPHLPIESIEISSHGGDVFRHAEITEPRLGKDEVTPVRLGSGTLRRAQREGAVASQMEIEIDRPAGRELDLVINDGNNPPLQITQIRARLATQPWIYFESPDGAPLRIRYGDEFAKSPAYDLEASRPYLRNRKTVQAKLAETPGLDYVVPAEPTTAIPLGGPLDQEQFRVRRAIQRAPKGLSLVILDAHVLANSPDLADVRVVDGSGQQVPYLVEQRAEPLPVKLAIPNRRAEQHLSIYRFELPYQNWPDGTRVVLTTNARVFDRSVTVNRVEENHRNRITPQLGSATWRSAGADLAAPPLTFSGPFRGVRAFDVVIDEGDNAPLPLESAQLLLPSSALRFYNPGRELFLLYGNARASSPRYDIALLAPRLFGVPARELSIKTPGVSAGEDEEPGRKIFWVGIAVAAVVLIVMLVRLLATLHGEEPDSLG